MFCYRTEGSKYIYTETVNEKRKTICRELYDLRDDPEEERNLWDKQREKAQEFELKILDYISKVEQERVKKRTIGEKERIARKIKGL